MKKRILSLLLCVAMLLTLLPQTVLFASAATSGTCGDNLQWSFDSTTGTLTITGSGEMTNWSSYSSVPWYSVHSSIQSVSLPSGLTSIGNNAFRDCSRLTSITIPDSVTSIGSYVFYSCSGLTNINIPSGVTSIGNNAFRDCSNLTKMELPFVGGSASSNTFFGYIFGASSSSNQYYLIPESLKSVVIKNGCKSIGNDAFRRCESLMSITIPDSVTSIGESAFNGCSGLKDIHIPSGVTSIGNNAFRDCSGLTNINIPSGVTSIGSNAFFGCSINTVSISDLAAWCRISFADAAANPLRYADMLFINDRPVTGIVIPDGVKSIGNYAFYGCRNLTSITIPESLTSIGENAFYGCSRLYSVRNHSNLVLTLGSTDNGYVAYYAKQILDKDGEQLYLAEGYEVTEDGFVFAPSDSGYSLLAYVGLQDIVTLPNAYKGASYIVADLYGILYLTIPAGITSFGKNAFSNSRCLLEINVDEDNPNYSGVHGVLMNKDKTELLRCPEGYEGILEIPEGVTFIAEDAFRGCSSLLGVTIPDSYSGPIGEVSIMTSMWNYDSGLFSGCRNLQSAVIGSGVTEIGDCTFRGCTNLKTVVFRGSVEKVGVKAFAECSSLECLVFPDGLYSVWYGAFDCCNADVYLPASLSEIDLEAFGFEGSFLYGGSDSDWQNVWIFSDNDGFNMTVGEMEDICDEYGWCLWEDPELIDSEEIDDYIWMICDACVHMPYPSCFDYDPDPYSQMLHTPAYLTAEAATCTEDGKTEGQYCSTCGATLREQRTLPALGHDLVPTEAVAPTCTEPGFLAGERCTRCDYVTSDEISAPGHDWETDAEHSVAATCTEAGVDAYLCTRCGETREDPVEPTGHLQGALLDQTDDSYTFQCQNAEHTYTDPKDGRLLGAKLRGVYVTFSTNETYPWRLSKNDSVVDTNAIISSNQGRGSSTSQTTIYFTAERSFTLSFNYRVSSESNYDKFTITLDGTTVANAISGSLTKSYSKELSAGTHSLTLKYSKDGSADRNNDTAYIYDLRAEVPCEHEWEKVSETPATCTEDGSISYICNLCSEEKTEPGVAALDHDWVADTAHSAAATCTAVSVDAFYCSRCDATKTESLHPALGHSWGVESVVDSTCMNDGCTNYTCAVCGATKTEAIEALGHSYEEDGICSRCCKTARFFTKVMDISDLTDGSYLIVCETESVAMDGSLSYIDKAHNTVSVSISDNRIEATDAVIASAFEIKAKDGGYSIRAADGSCISGSAGKNTIVYSSVANSITFDTNGNARIFSNEYLQFNKVNNETGYRFRYYSSTQMPIQLYKLGAAGEDPYAHVWVMSSEPTSTCTQAGEALYTCSRCHAEQTETVEALGHDLVTDAAVAATCEKAGLTEGSHCSRCDFVEAEQIVIPALGHDYYEDVLDKPTCTEEGVSEFYCTRCDDYYADYTPPLGHDFVVTSKTEATCTEDGSCSYACSRCEEVKTEVLPKTGHSYALTAEVSVTCTENGSKTYTCTACGDTYIDTITAKGHNYEGKLIIAPTCLKQGTMKYICTVCNAYYTEKTALGEHNYGTPVDNGDGTHTMTCTVCKNSTVTEAHSFENDVCACGSVKQLAIRSASLRLDESLNVVYAAEIPENCTYPYMVFSFLGNEFTQTDYTVNGSGLACFTLTQIHPQCMGDNISATLYATKDGKTVSVTKAEYSVRTYCVNQLAKTDDPKLITLLSDILTYGAAAQTYAGYKTDTLVTDGLDLTPSTFEAISGKTVSFTGEQDENTCWIGAALVLSNDLATRFTFVTDRTEGLTVEVSINGRAQTFDAFEDAGNGKYFITFDGIQATEFDDTVIATFYRNGEQIGAAVNYSVNTYICSTQNVENANLQALVRALYNYGASAKAYADTNK